MMWLFDSDPSITRETCLWRAYANGSHHSPNRSHTRVSNIIIHLHPILDFAVCDFRVAVLSGIPRIGTDPPSASQGTTINVHTSQAHKPTSVDHLKTKCVCQALFNVIPELHVAPAHCDVFVAAVKKIPRYAAAASDSLARGCQRLHLASHETRCSEARICCCW
jgi:hypothetical protein